jgi:hypothetical protein
MTGAGLALVLIGLAGGAISVAITPTPAEMVIENAAPESIQRGRVVTRHHVSSFGRVAPGQHDTVRVRVSGDTSYEVVVEFASGRKLTQSNLGYLTHGMHTVDSVRVTDTEIAITSSVVTAGY